MTKKAIVVTHYNGIQFNSRAEARWAVFFDAMCIPYECGKDRFELNAGNWYSPHFWLPTWNCWVEIKPTNPEKYYLSKPTAFVLKRQQSLLVISGNPWPGHFLINHFQSENGVRSLFNLIADCRRCNGMCLSVGDADQTGYSGYGAGVIDDDGTESFGFCNIGPHTCEDHDKYPTLSPGTIRAYQSARLAEFN